MSTVYRAFDTVLERQVAIKLMHREIAQDSDQLERFRREARAVAQLNHPHIVGVIDASEDDGMPVHRPRVRRGRDAEGPHPPARPAADLRRRRVRDRGRPGPRRRARAPDRPPRRQAAERPARRGGRGQGHRLRDRPVAGRRGPDRRRARARHDGLRLPRAGPGARGDRPERPVLARRRPLRDADRRRALPRREPGRRRHEARPRGAARRPGPPPRDLQRPGRRRRPGHGAGPRRPLRDGARPWSTTSRTCSASRRRARARPRARSRPSCAPCPRTPSGACPCARAPRRASRPPWSPCSPR